MEFTIEGLIAFSDAKSICVPQEKIAKVTEYDNTLRHFFSPRERYFFKGDNPYIFAQDKDDQIVHPNGMVLGAGKIARVYQNGWVVLNEKGKKEETLYDDEGIFVNMGPKVSVYEDGKYSIGYVSGETLVRVTYENHGFCSIGYRPVDCYKNMYFEKDGRHILPDNFSSVETIANEVDYLTKDTANAHQMPNFKIVQEEGKFYILPKEEKEIKRQNIELKKWVYQQKKLGSQFDEKMEDFLIHYAGLLSGKSSNQRQERLRSCSVVRVLSALRALNVKQK